MCWFVTQNRVGVSARTRNDDRSFELLLVEIIRLFGVCVLASPAFVVLFARRREDSYLELGDAPTPEILRVNLAQVNVAKYGSTSDVYAGFFSRFPYFIQYVCSLFFSVLGVRVRVRVRVAEPPTLFPIEVNFLACSVPVHCAVLVPL